MATGKKNDDATMRIKIIKTAIECVEKHGLHDLTIRRIAKEANVNIAAINYYFGSKEKLIDEVFRQTLYTGFDENIKDYFGNLNESPHDALKAFLFHFMSGGLQYPNLVKMHFYESFINNNYKTKSSKHFSSFLVEFEKIFKSIVTKKNGGVSKIDMVQFWSAVFFPIIFPGLFHNYAGIDFQDSSWLDPYINRLLKLYLAR